MRMSVVPKQTGRLIAWNLNRIVQDLAWHRQHSDDVILRGVRRNGEPMKMQVRHVHAGIHRTGLRGLGRKVIDVGDPENVARGSTNHGSHLPAVEGEGIPAIFIYCMQREGHNAILGAHLRKLWQGNTLGPAQSRKKYLRTNERSGA